MVSKFILVRVLGAVVGATLVTPACAPVFAQAPLSLREAAADTLRTAPWPALAPPAVPRPSGLVGRADLLQHASLSFAAGLGVGLVSESPVAAAGVSVSLGVAKELLDPRPDRWDLAADLFGAVLAALATHWLNR